MGDRLRSEVRGVVFGGDGSEGRVSDVPGVWRNGVVGQEGVFVGKGEVGIQPMELATRAMTVKDLWMGKRVWR